jgi:HEPN domain-containing protein
MKFEESRCPEDWFSIGDKELKRAQNLLSLEDLEGAGFNIQQAIEKYLKGYILSHGWELRRIHNLDVLLNEATAHDPCFEDFRSQCQTITHYYLIERYPLAVSWELTKEEIGESLSIAERIIRKVKELVEG